MRFRAAIAAAAGLALTLAAGCGSSSPQQGSPAGGTQAANTLVCKHYLIQRAWVKNLTTPTVADALKFEGYVTVDAAQSTGQLHRDLTAMSAAEQAGGSSYAESTAVYHDCGGVG
jgi:hypothetical protein